MSTAAQEKAVYAYPSELVFGSGTFGENLTTDVDREVPR